MSKVIDMNTEDTAFKTTIQYDDVDLSEYSPEELEALGIDIPNIQEEEEEEEIEEQESPEKEEEEEVEDEELEEIVEQAEKQSKQKEPRIPKSRFDEAVQKEREKAIRAEERSKYLEEQIERLIALQQQVAPKQESQAEPEYDFDAAEEQYVELLLQGDTKEAAQLRSQINREKDKWVKNLVQEVSKQAKEEAQKETKRLSESDKVNIVITEALAKYSFLDVNSEDYDEDLVEEINYVAQGYEQRKGMTASEALKKAIQRLVKEEPKKVVSSKAKEAKEKKVASMKQQPPTMESAKGIKDKKSTDFDFENMSQAEFRKLYKENPEIIKEALRKNYAV